VARRRGSIQQGTALLTTFRGGINRSEDAVGDELLDALDVVVDGSDLRRRPSWQSVAHGVPYRLPGGRVTLFASNDAINFSTPTHPRTPVGTLTRKYWYIGCSEKFDGIFWPSRWMRQIGPADAFSSPRRLVVYPNTGVTNFSVATDTTRRQVAGGRIIPLVGFGTISWHTESQTWNSTTVNGVAAYWIRLSMVDDDNVEQAFTPHLYEPGVEVFHLAPVTGLIQSKTKGRRTFVVGCDRFPARGVEKGAELGVLRNERLGVQRCWWAFDEGAGLYDQDSFSRGTVDKLTKDRRTDIDDESEPYTWKEGQHLGGQVIARNDGAAYIGVDVTAATASSVTLAEAAADFDNKYEHCRIRITRNASGGASNDYERAVVSSTEAGVLTFEDAFDATPNTGNDVVVRSPHAKLLILSATSGLGGAERVETPYEIFQTDAGHTLELVGVGAETAGVPYAATPEGFLEEPVYWTIAQELRWMLPSGRKWSHAYDPFSDSVYLANGRGVVVWDGQKIRPAEAASPDDPDLLQYLGVIVANDGQSIPLSAYHESITSFPDDVAFMRVWSGQLLVFGSRTIAWSAKSPTYNAFTWWLGQNIIGIPEDARGDIRGAATLSERLIVFTATSLFELVEVGLRKALRQVSHSIGFVSNWGVQQIVQNGVGMLLGPTPWGLAAWNGGEPVVVLESWDSVFDEQPTPSELATASSAVLQGSSFYLLGVGKRVLIYDWRNRRFWLWSMPWGVRSMCVELDSSGRERLLVGTEDGHVVTLADGWKDDGVEIINARVRGAFRAPNTNGEVQVYRGIAMARELPSDGSVTVNCFVDQRLSKLQSWTLYPRTQRATWGTAWGTLRWAEPEDREVDFGIRAGVRCSQIAVGVTSTRQFSVKSIEILGRGLAKRSRSG
jgi:hypothetical protein